MNDELKLRVAEIVTELSLLEIDLEQAGMHDLSDGVKRAVRELVAPNVSNLYTDVEGASIDAVRA